MFLIVDGHLSHRSKKTKGWVVYTNKRLRLFYLPGYSPQLNPDEWVQKNAKANRIRRACVTGIEDLNNKAEQSLMRLASLPELLMGFFHERNLDYIPD